jgi:hypothetical protein
MVPREVVVKLAEIEDVVSSACRSRSFGPSIFAVPVADNELVVAMLDEVEFPAGLFHKGVRYIHTEQTLEADSISCSSAYSGVELLPKQTKMANILRPEK